MNNHFKIVYAYRFEDGTTLRFDLFLDHDTLALTLEKPDALPDWTLLTHNRCAICPLDERSNRYCPVAAQLSGVVEKFSTFVSHDKVGVACIVEERTYSKNTTVQMGLSPLLGIIMTTSGCPVMEQLKPMVRFHLPFASLEETIFRMVSMHLVAQYLRKQAGKSAEWSLDGLVRIYAEVGQVNNDFADRLLDAAQNDVNVNALVNLDAFAKMVPLAAESMLRKINPYFSALLR
ncbi:MAG: hypothetical protein A2010_04680 [Nitrospirae bacterium GWD2_57_9]|nr:MAG: hypothetical protein A2010_04680 [Nitrospirae bacterium GWD2_57_9]OGW47698.1 MAG: hypothetical protein A2078_05810 [Nitrospirae bacterium GWC2_57_9]